MAKAAVLRDRVKEFRRVKASEIAANTRNFRTHPKEQAAALSGLLADVGIAGALVAYHNQAGQLTLLDGHLRKDTAPDTEWPVLILDVDEDEAKLLLASIDPLAAMAGTDADALEALLREVNTDNAAILEMLDGLAHGAGIETESQPGAGGDDFEDTPEDGPTTVQLGEVWQLGRHRIACIDSTDKESIERLLADASVHMVWADPPYGIKAVDVAKGTAGHGTVGSGGPFGGKGRIGTGKIIPSNLYAPIIGDDSIETAVSAASTCLELFPKAIQFWWGANNYAHALPPTTCWVVWDKRDDVPGNDFADGEMAWSNQRGAVRIFRHLWNGLLKASERTEKRVHPTQKPVALAVWAFEKYGKVGDTVFDPFLGSGMSVVAAEQTGRTVYGCELSPAYCDVVIRRWEAETGQTAERVS